MAVVSPSLTAGSGLKHVLANPKIFDNKGISQLNRWERIETSQLGGYPRNRVCISQLNRWERIETQMLNIDLTGWHVSPSLTAGSGLKQFNARWYNANTTYLPA